jgi:hypothetical protein
MRGRCFVPQCKLALTGIVIAFVCLMAGRASASPGSTERVSVASDGPQASGGCCPAPISPDGRFVGFHSNAANLVPADNGAATDVFLHDSRSGASSGSRWLTTAEEALG